MSPRRQNTDVNFHPFPKMSRLDESFQDLCVQKLAGTDLTAF